MTIGDVMRRHGATIGTFETAIITSAVIEKTKEYVLAHPECELARAHEDRITSLVQQRSGGIPLAYLLERKEFYGNDFFVTPSVLVPRPETELLVEHAIRQIRSALALGQSVYVLDIGTGSGCIAISIAIELRDGGLKGERLHIEGIDISTSALRVAANNARSHGVEDMVTLRRSDLLGNPDVLTSIRASNADIIFLLANLPYVPSSYLEKESDAMTLGLAFEPRVALDGGEDGLDAYRKLILSIPELKQRTGVKEIECLLEISDDQSQPMRRIFDSSADETQVRFLTDLAGMKRIARFTM